MNEDSKYTPKMKMQISPRRDKPHSSRPTIALNRNKKDITLTPNKQTNKIRNFPMSPNDNKSDSNNNDNSPDASKVKQNNNAHRIPMKRNHSQENLSSSYFELNSNLSQNGDEFEHHIQATRENLTPGVAIGRDGKTPVSSAFAKHKYKDMLTTYELTEINDYPEIYFIGNSLTKKTTKTSFDQDNTFQYNAVIGDHIAYRYEILSILGKGAFGTVLKCLDHKNNDNVAIKILVNTPVMQKQGQIEVDNMKLLVQDSISDELKAKGHPIPNVHANIQTKPKTKSKRSSSIDDALSPPKKNLNDNNNLLLSATSSNSSPKNLSLKHVIQLKDSFVFRNHICIITEILGESLYDFMKRKTKSKTQRTKPPIKAPPNSSSNTSKSSQKNQPQQVQPEQLEPLPAQLVKIIAYQIMDGLAAIHRKKIIHGDLKPENILFTSYDANKPKKKSNVSKAKAASKLSNSSKVDSPFSSPYQSPRVISHFNTSFSVIDNSTLNSQIKIIDFGSSCRQGDLIYNYIQSRFYRAPEVVLGAYYGPGIDIWSAGCIIAELFVGRPLFPASNEVDLLARFIETLGAPPTAVIQMQSDFVAKVTKNAKLKATSSGNKSKQGGGTVNAQRNRFFSDDGKLLNVANQPVPMKTRLSTFLKSSDALMIDFLTKCLEWDKDKRLSAAKLCKHPWISSLAVQKNM